MELKFTGERDQPKLPTLRQLLAQIVDQPDVLPFTARRGKSSITYTPPKPTATFLYDGYIYAVILGQGGNVSLGCDPNSHPCLNLRSQTIRAIDLDRPVEPINVEVHVPARPTHRYLHLHV